MNAAPETRYARSGDVNIAYQVVGEGPFDLVFVPGYVTHLELAWKLPGFGASLRELASFSRLIKFDKRGTGMSDPVSGAPTLETRMDDVRAVMDAVGSRRAALFGLSEGASMSALFAATYPERTAALILRSPFARTLWAPDYPWGRTEDEYEQEIERELRIYGPRDQALASARTLGRFDDDELEAFVDYLRYGASPGMLEGLLRMNKEIDIRQVLPAVRVPTLVLHGADDELVPPEAARYLAGRIPGARYIELPGVGHLALGGGGRSHRSRDEPVPDGRVVGRGLERGRAGTHAGDRAVHRHRRCDREGARARRPRLARAARTSPRNRPARADPLPRSRDRYGRRRLLRRLRRAGACNPLRLRHRGQRARAGHRRPGRSAHG